MRFALALILSLAIITPATSQTFPAGFSRSQVGGTLSSPTAFAFAPDGRIFVTEQGGNLRVIKNGALLATPFVTLTVDATGERGLIGIALDPDFAINKYVYLYYTVNTAPIHNRVSRFTANGDVVLANSEQPILDLDNLSSATNHNGGAIHFGADGKLYIAIGDNASGANAQNLDTYHGKFLRVNKDGTAPADNPFPSGTDQRKRVWAYGLRNPFTFDIQPGTGKIFLNDVGQNTWEEVDDATVGGRNFGWPSTEGATSTPGFTTPVFTYTHSGSECAITGGTFFNPVTTNYPPAYTGMYFIQDLCGGWISYFNPDVASPTLVPFGTSVGGQSLALSTGPDGNLYYLSRSNSRLYRVIYTPPADAPVITTDPQPQTITAGQTATFTVEATGAQPLNYQWQRNSVNVNGATAATLTITNAQPAQQGNYRAIVTNTSGTAASNEAELIVTALPQLPVITSQPQPSTVNAGAQATFTISFTGTPPLTFQWQKNQVNIINATSSTLTINSSSPADAGNYRVVVTNAAGSATSNEATLTVLPVNQKPTANIVTPVDNTSYSAATTVSYSGTASDPEQGDLPASAFKWEVFFYHGNLKDALPTLTNSKTGSFDVPNRSDLTTNAFYRIRLTVTDDKGAVGKDSVDVKPAVSNVTFKTVPPGLQVTIAGQATTTPVTFASVKGMLLDLSVVTQQLAGITYQFESWSQGGPATQTLATPNTDQTYTATFSVLTGMEDINLLPSLYPNPVRDMIYIDRKDVTKAELVGISGRAQTLTFVAQGEQTAIDISGVAPGVYALTCTFESGSLRRRIVVAR